MRTYEIHKIGGAGLMLPYQDLFNLIHYIFKNSDQKRIIIVVSAFAKITRMLKEIFEAKTLGNKAKALEFFEEVKKIHIERCTNLFIEDTNIIDKYLQEIGGFVNEGIINKEKPTLTEASILKFGELMSSSIFHKFLCNMHLENELLDAREIITASGKDYTNSQILFTESITKINIAISNSKGGILLTQGYIASNTRGYDKLLGFDGSDLTASAVTLATSVGNPISKIQLTYWKDVNGVMFENKIKENLNYFDFMELKTTPVRKDSIEILSRHRPKVVIRSFLNLENPGTTIVWR